MVIAARTPLVRLRYGAHLYGTDTPSSDIDLKGVFLPSGREILLGTVPATVAVRREKPAGEKNQPGEVEEEQFALHKFVDLLAHGQPAALDMLFAPRSAMLIEPAAAWTELVESRHRLVTRKAGAFINYCRQQTHKYGLRASRVAAVRRALEILSEAVAALGGRERVDAIAGPLRAFAEHTDHMAVLKVRQADGTVLEHVEVSGRKIPFSTSLRSGRDMMQRLLDDYGHRAMAVEQRQGVDWKGLSHAVRVARQGIELLETGRMTLPLPYASHILDIKLGGVPYLAVEQEIERLGEEIEAAARESTLPAEPDHAWIEDFILAWYGKAVIAMGDRCRP